MKKIWDISPAVGPASPVYPGDTPYGIRWLERIDEGAQANVSTLVMTPHVGAHADAPLHIFDGEKDAASLDPEIFLGPCTVIDLSASKRSGPITLEEIAGRCTEERILLKTRISLSEVWSDDFRAVSPNAVQNMKESGVRLIGLDVPSIDPAGSTDLESHKRALSGGIIILENLDLSEVPEGRYELIALPLRLKGAEASPIRAVLRTLDD